MKKVITFLGIRPQLTKYQYQGQVYEGHVFAEAIRQFSDFDLMLVFVTKEALTNSYPALAALQDERIVPIQIPTGENSAEMWATFEAITEAVDKEDSVIFDITHSLRSIPFLVFLAAAFLKSAKQVKIEAIFYGAFELQKDAQGNSRPAPVIELSEFVSLLDWMNASEQFIKLGDAKALVEQLRKTKPSYQLQQHNQTVKMQSISLSNAATALEKVSRALRLILPDRAMEASEDLQGHLVAATDAMMTWARPFSVLSQQVLQAYAPLALSHSRDAKNLVASLNRERYLIKWYLERNLLAQAIATAREWLITWGLLQAGYDNPYEKTVRREVEEAFNHANKQRQNSAGHFDDYCFTTAIHLTTIPAIGKALDLYASIADLRNTLMHAGKRESKIPTDKLERNAMKFCEQLHELPMPSK